MAEKTPDQRAMPGSDVPVNVGDLFGAMTDIVLVLDRKGRYLWVADTLATPQSMRGRISELIGHTLHETLDDLKLADQLVAVIAATLDTGKTQQVEYEINLWGQDLWLAAAVSPLPDDRVVWVARDVTDRVKARERLEDRVEERTRVLSALVDVSKTLSSTLDVRSLMREVLEKMHTIIEHTSSAFVMLEGDSLIVRDAQAAEGADAEVGAAMKAEDSGYIWETIGGGREIIIDDLRSDEPAAVALRQALGYIAGIEMVPPVSLIRAWLAVPLATKDRVVGMLTVSSDTPGFFTPDHARLVRAFADQAAAAIDNARLFQQTEDRTRELSVLLDVSRKLASATSLSALVSVIVEEAKRVIDYTGSSTVEFEDGALRIIESAGPEGREENLIELRTSTAPGEALWQKIRGGSSVIIDDVHNDSEDAKLFRATWEAHIGGPGFAYMRSWMALPLGLGGRVIGLLSLSKDVPGYFTERHLELAEAITRQASVAAENASLLESTQRRAQERGLLLDVSRALSSTLELQPLLQLILDKLKPVMNYDGAGISLMEKSGIRQLAVRRPPGYSVREDEAPQHFVPIGTDDALWSRVRHGEPFIVDDVWGDSAEAIAYRAPWGGETRGTTVEYVRCLLTIPLLLRDQPIGALAFARTEPGSFTQQHIDLAQAIAGPAAAAIENARLFEQTQARTQEMSSLLEVSRVISATLDLRDVMAVVLDELQGIVRHSGSAMLVAEGDDLVITESRADAGGAEREIGARIPAAHAGLLWEMMSSGQPIIIPDVREDDEMTRAFWQSTRELGIADKMPFNVVRSWMAVPLALEDQVIGMITMSWTEPDYFTRDHARLVAAFASQAALAIDHARLFERTQSRTRELSALLDVSRAVTSTLDLQQLMGVILEQLHSILEHSGSAVLVHEGDDFVIKAARSTDGTDRELGARIPIASSDQIIGAIFARQPVIIADIRSDEPLAASYRATIGALGLLEVPPFSLIRSWMGLPLVAGDEVIGMLTMSRTTPNYFTDDHARLVGAFASQVSIAIKQASLFEQTGQVAALEERQRLARELHDSVSQALYGIALGARTARTILDREPAKAIEPVDYVLSLAEAGLAEMRSLIFELRPESLASEGLVAAIDKQIASTRARYGLEITADLADEPDISLERKEALYRITQEALHNVVKHANASTVHVSLASDNGHLTLSITDDGSGFDPDGDFPGHLGLQSMRERAEKSGARFAIRSKPGDGARVELILPAG